MKNNFEEYGFAGNFEGEILKVIDGNYIGYYKDLGIIPTKWHEDGLCFEEEDSDYNLTPIKKEWYEKEDNFPCLVKILDDRNDEDKEYFDVLGNINAYKAIEGNPVIFCLRPATKEELLSLLVEV